MRIRIVFYCFCLFILASCGARKNTSQKHQKKQKQEKPIVVVEETKPKNLPSVNENEFIKNLKKENPNLNKARLAYIKKYMSIARQEMLEYNIPASITLAQGILESSSGKSELASKSNNHFGIKCHAEWQGERVYHDDDEKGECFRKYKYVATSYKNHSEFLTQRKRYSFLFDYNIMDYKKWANGLRKAGYATDKKYPNKLIKIIEDYQLYNLDRSVGYVTKVKKETKKLKKPTYTIGNYYRVKKGDTLYAIARKMNTTVANIKEINGLKNNTISIGQHLLIK